MYVRMYVCMYDLYVCTPVCMYVCMYSCMYVREDLHLDERMMQVACLLAFVCARVCT
jgi:hypothetical protein